MTASKKQHGAPLESLTKREMDVLRLMENGYTNEAIAHELVLEVSTVRWYIKQIFAKLDVHHRVEAINTARELGLFDEPVTTDEITEPRHNLPRQMMPFIGREHELVQLNYLMEDNNVRLLTILAPGGMGKTRLALELGQRHLTHYPDGVCFVPLAQLNSAAQLIATMANELELHIQEDRELKEQVHDYLSTKRMLLILDNFEHLLDAAPLVNEIVQAAPRTRLIITSREKLALTAEKVFPIEGLPFPASDTIEDAFEYDAVRLFLRSAGLEEDDVGLETAPLARICRLIGGMPLAILLAAGWADVLSLAEIADEIQKGLDFLVTEMQDLAPRHQSMRAVFDPTWKRLTESEKTVFMKFAVFRGGCTREAAQAVTEATLGQLRAFVNKALLSHTPDSRYVIHELLRQYTEEHLKAAGADDLAYDTHQRYYLNFLREREVDLKGQRQLEALAEIRSDFANVYSAWHWAVDHQDHTGLDQAVEGLLWFLVFGNRFEEGVRLLGAAADSLADASDAHAHRVWRRVAVRQAYLATLGFMDRPADRRGQVEALLKIAYEHDDKLEMGVCLLTLSQIAWQSLDEVTAIDFSKQSLACFQEVNDRFYMVRPLEILAIGTVQNEWCRRGLELARQVGDKFGMAKHLYFLGTCAVFAYENEAGLNFWQEALVLQRQTGDLANYAVTCAALGHNQISWNVDYAREMAEEAWKIATEINHPNGKGYALITLGWLAAFDEDYVLCRQRCEEGRTLSQNSYRIATANWGLSIAACGLGDYSAALRHTRSQMEFGLSDDSNLSVLRLVLVPSMLILAHLGETRRAVELVSLLTHLPRPSPYLRWPISVRLHTKLKAELSEETYQAAWERGKSLDLETVVQNLLAEFGKG